MIAVTFYFPDELETVIRAKVTQVYGADRNPDVSPEFRVGQFFCGMITAALSTGLRRPDLGEVFKQMNYRAQDRPEG